MTRRCWNWPPEHIQIGWVSKFGRLLTIKNLPFAWQWACAIFWRARTALELACRQSNRALHSSTGAVQSREYSLLRRVFVGLDLSRSSASVETDENSPLRFWWKVSCRYSQHGGVLRRYHSAECHCARSCRGSHVMEAGGYRAPANPVFFFLSTFIVKFQYIATVVGVGTCQEHHRAVERCSCTSPTAVCSSGACNVHHSRCDAPSVGRCRTASVCECSC